MATQHLQIVLVSLAFLLHHIPPSKAVQPSDPATRHPRAEKPSELSTSSSSIDKVLDESGSLPIAEIPEQFASHDSIGKLSEHSSSNSDIRKSSEQTVSPHRTAKLPVRSSSHSKSWQSFENTPLSSEDPALLYDDEPSYPIMQSPDCLIVPSNQTINYFHSRLILADPNFIHIQLVLRNESDTRHYHPYNATSETVHPNKWVWTYQSENGIFPYLNWNTDYGLLSFGLLDSKTLHSRPFITLYVPDDCTITYGTYNTTRAIANALLTLTGQLGSKYQRSYYCYLAEAPDIRETFQYQLALYFLLPISYINYNCCSTYFNYSISMYTFECLPKQMEKWKQCTIGPYILGVILYLYFPLSLMRIAASVSRDLKVEPEPADSGIHSSVSVNQFSDCDPLTAHAHDKPVSPDLHDDDEWLYLDGNSPKTLFGMFDFVWCGLQGRYPILVSRIKRIIFVVLAPLVVYIQLIVYYCYFNNGVDIHDLIEHRTPMGFLGLLANESDGKSGSIDSFAPAFGGPKCLFITYFVFAFIFIVIPTNLSQIMENGMPVSVANTKSPLWLGAKDIRKLSKLTIKPEAGYMNCMILCKCGIYILFSRQFWTKVFQIQRDRFASSSGSSSICLSALKLVLLPVYVVVCLIEVVVSVIFFGVPLCTLVSVYVRGAMWSVSSFRAADGRRNRACSALLTNPVFVIGGSVLVCIVFVFFIYTLCLVFIQSFSFLAQIFVFCFVAVIVYPSESFGYLFFFVILIYYLNRLIHGFGDMYLELLYETVDISRNLEGHQNHATVYDGHLVVSNVKQLEIKSLRINDKDIQIPTISLRANDSRNFYVEKVRLKKHIYGIPKRLFEDLVAKHRPVHEQVLRIAFHIGLIVFLLLATMSITTQFVTGPTSEISEMMHVVFIVTVGALPRVLEVAMSDASEPVKKEIELRHLEESIVEFWQRETELQRQGSCTYEMA